jgi:hypothetical protein
MSHGPLTFRQRDIKAAIKAVEAAGHKVARIEIERDGRLVVVLVRPAEDAAPAASNEWDVILENPA